MGRAKLTELNIKQDWPSFLQSAEQTIKGSGAIDPVIINKDVNGQLEKLIKEHPKTKINDVYKEQLAELILSKDPHLYNANYTVQKKTLKDIIAKEEPSKKHWEKGSWVYYPWDGILVHMLEEKRFNQLRTIRNRDLITDKDQEVIQNFNVGCVGMSVGSSSAIALTISGMSKQIKLADGAVISGSNLNRILASVDDVGRPKTSVIARKLYKMNPYINVHINRGKLTNKNIESFFSSPWKLDLIIDEIDDLEMKIRIRLKAKEHGIPVLMATELADTVMLDVERYDLDKDYPIFHGLAGDIEHILEKDDIPQREWMKLATSIIGTKNVPVDMQQSLMKIGSKVVTHPQLGTTAIITGGILAFVAKKIALGEHVPSQREAISLDKVFLPNARTRKASRHHKKHTKMLKRTIGSI